MVAEALLMRETMAMALLLLLGLCSVSLSAASALPDCDGLNQKSLDFTSGHLRHRSLLQAPTPTPVRAPPTPAPANPSPPPANQTRAPANPTPAPANPSLAPASPTPAPASPTPAPQAPILPPSPPPRGPPAPPTPVRVYLMWIGIGAFILVMASVAVFCLCRKFGENKISRGQRLPPLPRYH